MLLKSAAVIAALALLTLASAHARAQTQQQKGQSDEAVVDEFVTSRGFIIEVQKPSAKSKATTRPPRRVASAPKKKATPPDTVKQGGGPAAGTSDAARQNNAPAVQDAGGAGDGVQVLTASTLPPLGLGYSIYLRDEATGGLLPAPAGKTYRTGDAIFMVIEPNADGYLYVFNAENGKDPVMIYPSVLLRGGENDVRAHIRETYPEDPELPFRFEDPPANEHLYLVLSREPLAGVPTGAALVKYCGKNADECLWRPTASLWARISASALDRGVREWRGGQIAQADAQPVTPVTLQRGIRVKRDAPRPMTVRVSRSPAEPLVVTKIELMHK